MLIVLAWLIIYFQSKKVKKSTLEEVEAYWKEKVLNPYNPAYKPGMFLIPLSSTVLFWKNVWFKNLGQTGRFCRIKYQQISIISISIIQSLIESFIRYMLKIWIALTSL